MVDTYDSPWKDVLDRYLEDFFALLFPRIQNYTACDLWDCKVRIDFPTVKLREYNQRWGELEASANPFATVVMAHLKAQSTRKKPEERYRWKLRLVRRLYEQGFSKDDVLQLFRFIDWVMDLPKELEERLDREIQEIETEQGMQYVTSIERRALKRGVEQGIQQGIQQGVQQGEARLLRRQLIRRHGDLPALVEQRLETASTEEIERWADRVLTAQTLDDIFK